MWITHNSDMGFGSLRDFLVYLDLESRPKSEQTYKRATWSSHRPNKKACTLLNLHHRSGLEFKGTKVGNVSRRENTKWFFSFAPHTQKSVLVLNFFSSVSLTRKSKIFKKMGWGEIHFLVSSSSFSRLSFLFRQRTNGLEIT